MSAGILTGCGLFTIGGGSTAINDPAPTGTIVAQGQFTGANNKTVTGTVYIYRTETLSYILRIENLSAPGESALFVSVRADGQDVLTAPLRGNSGNQNYSISIGGASTWSKASIKSSAVAPPHDEYGVALLDNLLQS